MLRTAGIIAVLFASALCLRLLGSTREPLWLDETYSAWFSDNGPAEILRDHAGDQTPPLHGFLLYAARGAFGDSTFALRLPSLLASLLGAAAAAGLAWRIAGALAAICCLALIAVHPLDIYYAQEARPYALTAALAAVAAAALWRWISLDPVAENRRACVLSIVVYACVALALLYTHYLGAVLLFAQGLIALSLFAARRRWKAALLYLALAALVALAFAPWICFVLQTRDSFYLAQNARWMSMPHWSECFRFAGRELLWSHPQIFAALRESIFFILPLGVCVYALIAARWKRSPAPLDFSARLFLVALYCGPVALAVIVCHFYNNIYYSGRFSLLVLHPFLILLAVLLAQLPRLRRRIALAALLCGGWLAISITQFFTREKEDWNSVVSHWPNDRAPAALAIVPGYYFVPLQFHLQTRLQPASRSDIERLLPYLGAGEIWLAHKRGLERTCGPGEQEYYAWLCSLPHAEEIELGNQMTLRVIRATPANSAAAPADSTTIYPLDANAGAQGFGDAAQFSGLEFARDGRPYRWSRAQAALTLAHCAENSTIIIQAALPPPVQTGYAPGLRFHAIRGDDAQTLWQSPPLHSFEKYAPGEIEFALVAPPGSGSLILGWKINAVNLKQAGISNDNRDLGLQVFWIKINPARNLPQ